MKISKYSHLKEGQVKASSIIGGGGGGSSTTIEGGSLSLDRTIWGKQDVGEDIDGHMIVNGDITIQAINYEWDDEEDDEDGEDVEYDEGGGNLNVELLTTTKDLEVNNDAYIHQHLYINYPSHQEHSDDNKKCIGEILESVEKNIKKNADDIATNKTNIASNLSEINKLKTRVTNNEKAIETNATNIDLNEIAIKNNNDEIIDLKNRTTANETAIANYLPIGSIIMFSGTMGEIPEGWAICNGENGTPNLIDKFIRASTVAGISGGSNSVTLSTDNLPSHNHTIEISNTVNKPNTIDANYMDKLVQALDELYENPFDLGGGSHFVVETGYNNKSDKGLVGIKVKDLVGSTISVNSTATIGNTGSNTQFDIVPQYYSLLFIMKIS